MQNIVEFKVWGKYAMFTDPLTKVGGEKYSYQIPTYEALKGVLSSVYWKPTIVWIIDKVRVIKAIKTQTRSAKPVKYGGVGHDLSIYTYLADVEYQVQAHFEWNLNRADLAHDRNENKHYFVAKRMIERGGRRDVFLGTRECQAYVEPCTFNEGDSFYDNYPGEISFGLMFHGFDYPDEATDGEVGSFYARFWRPTLATRGLVEFVRPDNKSLIRKFLRPMQPTPPATIGLAEEGLLEGYVEEA
jgi:CRISPR-associated protein Cas5d